MIQQNNRETEIVQKVIKPLLRGWFHAFAAGGAVVLTIILCWLSRNDMPRLWSMLIFGLSMVELYTVSAVYHIGNWRPGLKKTLRAFDHSNIFILIAGTYTPLCFNLLTGWVRIALLITIWILAILGVSLTAIPLTLRLPRWVNAILYIAMGWVAVLAFPAFLAVLPWTFVATMVLGGVLYTIGGIIYALRKPDPIPHIFGFHEIFHLFVIAGSIAFAASVWIWALPFPRA
ncbi:PAQR family membrane homeostasis protein TrhA [Tengunoibacter tsumagoiensis]|uniref:Hemolysin III n=1 Tax=Tengunoibacter tsumagoiensis TaxID=2014871 RepID=A0A401ZYE8_9CHLR|nr:hemolysin III family protein [Tengunoibacter tsumagoiensis]GCE11888.1 hemolysin III [Tengunoibacter tsumagoiensis]